MTLGVNHVVAEMCKPLARYATLYGHEHVHVSRSTMRLLVGFASSSYRLSGARGTELSIDSSFFCRASAENGLIM